MPKIRTPYGGWPSAWSAEQAAAASREFAELQVAEHGLFWSEFNPQDACSRLWHWQVGTPRCLTPDGYSVRSRVYEYGGGAFCLTDQGLAFVNEADQQIYLQTLDGQPRRLTNAADSRFGALCFAARQQAVLAVEEWHGPEPMSAEQADDDPVNTRRADAHRVVHRLVSIGLADGVRRVLIEGADFYAAPTVSADGTRLAWIEWSRPEQPWTATRLCLAESDGQGGWLTSQVLAGQAQNIQNVQNSSDQPSSGSNDGNGENSISRDSVAGPESGDGSSESHDGESLQQPRFAAAGRLFCLSDRNGWWQPWAEQHGQWLPVGGAMSAFPANPADAPDAPYDVASAHAPAFPTTPPVGCAAGTEVPAAPANLIDVHGVRTNVDDTNPPTLSTPLSVGCATTPVPQIKTAGAHDAPYDVADVSSPVFTSPACAIANADHAAAPGQLGACSYLPLAAGGLLLSRFVNGWGQLWQRNNQGEERRFADNFSRFSALAADEQYFYCIAASPERVSALLAIDRLDGAVQVVAGGEQLLAADQLSLPQSLTFASDAEQAHGFFYPPSNAACRGPDQEQPPLLVFVHGGPVSACYPAFDARIQFWTQRGFAVADLNYRGSSGYGRAYRQRLKGQWGVLDVADAVALVAHLAARALIDPARAFIRGSSAGGYTTLCALAFHAVFRAGASLYGVSDPLTLRRLTHKFEADYLDWLIGDPARDAERYQARTPLYHADKIESPVIFFQGGQDTVVLPQQTETMVAALEQRGVCVEYHCYADERHGFRQAAHLADVLQREWRFYQRFLH
ncbi:MAG: alpha/beta hydrolase family protein [Pseudomonas sp.]